MARAMRGRPRLAVPLFSAFVLAACSSSDPWSGSDDPEALGNFDHGAVSKSYPAFKPDSGQLVFRGGPVLSSPRLVTITWDDLDPAAFADRAAAVRARLGLPLEGTVDE